jgi:hypothetical protein
MTIAKFTNHWKPSYYSTVFYWTWLLHHWHYWSMFVTDSRDNVRRLHLPFTSGQERLILTKQLDSL